MSAADERRTLARLSVVAGSAVTLAATWLGVIRVEGAKLHEVADAGPEIDQTLAAQGVRQPVTPVSGAPVSGTAATTPTGTQTSTPSPSPTATVPAPTAVPAGTPASAATAAAASATTPVPSPTPALKPAPSATVAPAATPVPTTPPRLPTRRSRAS